MQPTFHVPLALGVQIRSVARILSVPVFLQNGGSPLDELVDKKFEASAGSSQNMAEFQRAWARLLCFRREASSVVRSRARALSRELRVPMFLIVPLQSLPRIMCRDGKHENMEGGGLLGQRMPRRQRIELFHVLLLFYCTSMLT